ncbi:MAG: DNA-directed RNA polymerase specialized sigma subunit [Phormidesmis priestleyi Ana]|uniref:DNA-directed RNA polymerase specialized sigma subunit n=1 Tax=Phormidesmis priestleyi Ana TaxID=1666911 RepID=A0A0P7YRL8_9CYAN|nr:MAG: DNA-directed RNA polymerase specialized sigma subunit [Phormidesmis priestleyi Ana]
MRTRQTLIEIFSSFLQFEGDRFKSWHRDPRLQRHMERCCQASTVKLATDEVQGERYWALHWHQQWSSQFQAGSQPKSQNQSQSTSLSQTIARDHLLAYLQETCYWAAYKVSARFSSTQYGLYDCFQLAIAQFEKVLTGFDAQQGFDLKNYAGATFRSFIRDHLRQRREVDICTDWSLLRKVSQKRLHLALQNQGLSDREIASYILAWQAYKLVYVPAQETGSRQLAAPDLSTWEAISAQYNRERHCLSAPANTLIAKQAETWMVAAAKAVRSYLYPSAVSMNATRPGQDAGEFIDSFTDDDQVSPLGELMAEEAYSLRQQQYTQLGDILAATVAQLEPDAQKLIALYYGDTLTQKAIADQLGIKQYAISRQLTRIKKTLLLALAQWSEKTLHIPPASDLLNHSGLNHSGLNHSGLNHSGAALEAWLTNYYGSKI